MKRISNFLLLMLLTGMFFTSCVKDRNVGPDFSSTAPMLELKTPQSNIAGQAYFGRAVIGNLPDTVQFYANLAAAYAADRDIAVTIGVDPSRLDNYNADPANTLKYVLLPDSDYVILKTTGTIVNGQHIDSFQVAFFKDKIDPTTNYMLPIAITDGDGIQISQNQGLIFFHAIGNPLAGDYLQSWYRWNDAPDTTGAPNSTISENVLVSVAPEDPTTIFLPEGYLTVNGLGGVSLGFTNNNGVITDPFVFLNETTTDNLTSVGFTTLSGPTLVAYEIKGDASNHYAGTMFRIYYEVLNSSGGNRKTINIFTKQ
jgi:hypothetical protein